MLICSAAAVLLVQVGTAKIQFNTGDEGYLWYGIQRVLAGEWPQRDFNSYDPGRYLLFAGWARLWGSDKIVVMRLGIALLQWTILLPALLLVRPMLPRRANWVWLATAAVAMAVWMVPRHKMPDIGATVWMTAILAWLCTRPGRTRYRVAGFVAGLFWLIGRNHLLYGTVSLWLAWAWLAWESRQRWRETVWQWVWIVQGYLTGLLPMALLLCIVPGYAKAYWQHAVVRLTEIKSTTVYLPIPWPWAIQFKGTALKIAGQALVGLGFAAVPTAVAAAVFILIKSRALPNARRYPILTAATVTTVAWAYQAFYHADLPHLAQATLPLAILLLCIPHAVSPNLRPLARGFCWTCFAGVAVAAAQLNPAVQASVDPVEPFLWQDIGGENLYVPAQAAAQYQVALAVARRAGPHPNILIEPYFPGLYAALRLRCPVFDAYPLYPATVGEQRQSIASLENHHTDWAIIWPYRIDARPDLGFDHTDPLVWNYLRQRFQPADLNSPTHNALVLHRP